MNKFVTEIYSMSDRSKYARWYLELILRSLDRPKSRAEVKKLLGYVERHHIIPKCINSEWANEKENLVFLTAREHFISHLLLAKMFKNTRYAFGLISAAHRFTTVQGKNKEPAKISSRIYEYLKKEFRNSLSKISKGRVPWNKGKKHSEETKLKISKAHTGRKNGKQSEEWVKKRTSHRKGIPSPIRGIVRTEEYRNRMSESRLKTNKKICEFCGKSLDPGCHARFHGQKCKLNIQET